MRKEVAEKAQIFLKQIATNSVGRSVPYGIFEKKIPKNVMDAIRKSTSKTLET